MEDTIGSDLGCWYKDVRVFMCQRHKKPLKKRTVDGGATDQVGVGEVERSLQLEVRFQDLPGLLADVEKHSGASQGNLPLLAQLQKGESRRENGWETREQSRRERGGHGPSRPSGR